MPIKDLEMMQRQLGRIRTGDQVPTKDGGKTRPHKLDKFRFTAPSKELIDAAAALYGGTPRPWNNDGKSEYEVYSEVSRVPILVPPKHLTQWYELHTAAGCLRRCDGVTNIVDDTPCKCPKDGLERALMAQSGRACKPTTRLNVVLPDMPGIGVWRVDSHGYHAATKLPSVAELLAYAAGSGRYIPAHLVLELQSSKRPGEGKREWYVPLIDVGASPRELMAGAGQPGIAQLSGGRPGLTGGQKAIESARPDYVERAKQCTTPEAVTAIWKQAFEAGHLTDALKAQLAPIGQKLRAAAHAAPASCGCGGTPGEDDHEVGCPNEPGSPVDDGGVVDAEIVPDVEELDRLWALVLENAPSDWNRERLEGEFAQRSGGTLPASADEKQLGAFLQWLQNGGAR